MTDIATTPALGIGLPGQWRRIPLDEPDAAHAAIDNLIRRRVGNGIRDSATRNELRCELCSLADSSVGDPAVRMYVALSLRDALPLTAALTVSASTVATRPDSWGTAVRRETNGSFVLRRNSQRVVEGASPNHSRNALTVDYWMPIPAVSRLTAAHGERPLALQLSFTTPYAEHEAVMLARFDDIVRQTWWQW